MEREQQIEALRKNIAELETRIRSIPERAAEMRRAEESTLAVKKVRGDDGYLELTRGDWPSDGLLRIIPTLQEALTRDKARLALLLTEEVPTAELIPRAAPKPPPDVVEAFDKMREHVAVIEDRLEHQGDGGSFDNIVRSQLHASLVYERAKLQAMIRDWPGLAEDPQATPAADTETGPTRDQVFSEPTVKGNMGESPFPPSVDRLAGSAPPVRRRKR